MSMLSAQCDKLRETAELVEGHGKVGFGDLIITDPLMVDAAKELRDAADTIWRLRNDCVELRELLNITDESRHFADTRARELFAKNEKLRELVSHMYWCICAGSCDECERCNEEDWDGCEIINVYGSFRDRMAKLGIEVTT